MNKKGEEREERHTAAQRKEEGAKQKKNKSTKGWAGTRKEEKGIEP